MIVTFPSTECRMTNRHPTFVCIAVFGPLRILVDAGPGRDSDLFLVAVKPDNYEDRYVYFWSYLRKNRSIIPPKERKLICFAGRNVTRVATEQMRCNRLSYSASIYLLSFDILAE